MKPRKKPFERTKLGKKLPTLIGVKEATELMDFLLFNLPGKNRNNIKTLLANKQVFIEGKAVKQFNHPLKPGQQVEIRWQRIPEEKKYRGITIIYEDPHLIVIDKHAGMLSIATKNQTTQTAYNLLSKHVKSKDSKNKIFVVHRLDRETSGLMLFARNKKVQEILQSNWHDIITERTYIAVVEGIPQEGSGTITSYLKESKAMIVYSSQNPDHGEKATTHYKLLNKGRDYSMLKVNLESGKKNQIRVHMQDIGHPVTGDKKYGAKTHPIGRLALHSWILAFRHPITKEALEFKTEIPGNFRKLSRS
ncbi:MAG: RluA family pseudouridine synthase [Bacteroidales bacterium]|nr:RluA family pseudouridine synthase [Bacteroidales bacterium]MCF8405142.1 RluA family pseudouridine synthase [Bacteroidales bacterium]